MSSLIAYSASAGSGKTFRLTHEYIKQIIKAKSARSFRHILAVTFTNKATAEMKQRILKVLHSIAMDNKDTIGVLQNELQEEGITITPEELKQVAANALKAILHEYSRFSVVTIDKFFQKILRSFINELGLQPNFALELDADRLLNEATDLIFENANDNKQLQQWLLQFLEQELEEAKSWNFRDKVKTLGRQLFKENFMQLHTDMETMLQNKDALNQYITQLKNIITQVDKTLDSKAEQALQYMTSNNIEIDSFKNKQRGVAGHFYKVKRKIYTPSDTAIKAIDNIDIWLKTDQQTPQMVAAYEYLNNSLSNILNYWGENERAYETAKAILQNIMSFGLLSDIYKQITQLSSNENILLISDTARLLKGLIGNSEVPFVYEKVGNHYHSFMIDEFQDTSVEQWSNFRPLIENCLSQNDMAMVVGDVKQSIYRFRNGDWRILAQGIDHDLSKFGAVNRKVLEKNYRSLPTVVHFNNELLQRVVKFLQEQVNHELEQGTELSNAQEMKQLLHTAYADVAQIPQKTEGEMGFVQIEFINKDKDQESSSKELTIERIPALLKQLLQQGYHSKDIAILTRTSREARSIVDALLVSDNATKFSIISQDALMLNASPMVQLCISLMRLIVGQKDEVSHAFAAQQLHIYQCAQQTTTPSQQFVQCLPKSDIKFLQGLALQALPEMFENLIQHFHLNQHPEELPFLQALHDHILNFANRQLSDLSSFLNWWDERKNKLPLQCPEGQDAITVSSIHKSKGLEYKVVILPFATWELDTKTNSDVWFNTTEAPFNKLQSLPIKYTNALNKTIFAEQRTQEKLQAYVENLNLLYVALTRAQEQLYVFAQNTNCKDNINHIGQLLQKACDEILNGTNDDFTFGKITGQKTQANQLCFGTQSIIKQKEEEGEEQKNAIPLQHYPSQSLIPRVLIRQNPYDILQGNNTQQESGTMWHKIFEQIITTDDITNAIETQVNEGTIKASDFDNIHAQLTSMLTQPLVADWFSGKWEVHTERNILLPPTLRNKHHLIKRPDRIMLRPNEAIVVDYKFGLQQKTAHTTQLQSYIDCLRQMGYTKVQGFVWYVNLEQVQAVG
ncbi:MAG: UvrD-helicase domain-containing protein [Bacteroidales bacterium]